LRVVCQPGAGVSVSSTMPAESASESAPRAGLLDAIRSSRARLIALAVASLVGAVVYGRVAGLVYPEDSDFALEFGNHSWYHALTFGQIIEQYFKLGHGWYRPTGFYLLPYLFRIDYFQPAEQVSLDIATMIVAAAMITLFFRHVRALPAVVGVLAVLLAPALYEVSYGVQADSFYIIFGMAFLLVADELFDRPWERRRRWALRAALVVLFALTITTKEVGAGVAFLLVPVLIVRGPQLSRERVRRAIVFASPFMFVSVIFAIVYRTQVSAETGTYSTHPSLERLLNFVNLISWTFGFRSPRHTFTQWIPAWSGGEKLLAIVMLLVLAGGLLLTWRQLKLWRIAIYVATALAIAVAIAAVGGIPYHGYPIVVMYGVAFIVVLQALMARVERFGPWQKYVVSVAMVALIAGQLVQGYQTFGDALYRGPHTAYLEASTELFDGSTLAPVHEAVDSLLVFQDCLGGLHNPLTYYARTGSGTSVSVSQFNLVAQEPAMEAARKERRPVFVALCTGRAGPWYVLDQWEGKAKGLVAAPP
jgi:hypothetical protein